MRTEGRKEGRKEGMSVYENRWHNPFPAARPACCTLRLSFNCWIIVRIVCIVDVVDTSLAILQSRTSTVSKWQAYDLWKIFFILLEMGRATANPQRCTNKQCYSKSAWWMLLLYNESRVRLYSGCTFTFFRRVVGELQFLHLEQASRNVGCTMFEHPPFSQICTFPLLSTTIQCALSSTIFWY